MLGVKHVIPIALWHIPALIGTPTALSESLQSLGLNDVEVIAKTWSDHLIFQV
jgi:hypothetical protein